MLYRVGNKTETGPAAKVTKKREGQAESSNSAKSAPCEELGLLVYGQECDIRNKEKA